MAASPTYLTPADRTTPQLPNIIRARLTFGICVTCAAVASFTIILRVASRRLKGVKLAAEDHVIFAALCATYAMCAGVIAEVLVGAAGFHVKDVFPGRTKTHLQLLIVVQSFFGVSLALCKASIVLLIRRLFTRKKTVIRACCYVVLVLCLSWGIMCVLIAFLICHPLSYNWDHTVAGGSCANIRASWIAIGVTDILTDMSIMALPIRAIVRLQLPLGRRLSLMALFSAGMLTMAISGIRIYTLVNIDLVRPPPPTASIHRTNTSPSKQTDITFSATSTHAWSAIEPTAGIVIASAPVMRPLFRRVFLKERQSRSTTLPPRQCDTFTTLSSDTYTEKSRHPDGDMESMRRIDSTMRDVQHISRVASPVSTFENEDEEEEDAESAQRHIEFEMRGRFSTLSDSRRTHLEDGRWW